MCLILIAHALAADLPLVVAANRDESHARPAAPAQYWRDHPDLLAGRDLRDGGTWIGVQRTGRFAAVTNFAEGVASPTDARRSRGELTAGFLNSVLSPAAYLAEVALRADQYRGFSLLVGDARALHHFSNREGPPRQLPPGVYGLSNGALDSPWPKVRTGKDELAHAVAHDRGEALIDRMFALLASRDVVADHALLEEERDLPLARRGSPRFIVSETYGTRASTVVVARRLTPTETTVAFAERSFGPSARDDGRVDYTLNWPHAPG
jgi:uncharacterized protein with NRDE domain